MNSRTVALLIASISAVLVAWLGRYEVVAVPSGSGAGYAYRLDRWTGNVIWIQSDASGIVKEEQK